MPLQGLVTYPGIQAVEDFQITDTSGISPSVAIMTVYPQFGLPAAQGDIVLTYGGSRIVFANMIVDAASFQRNSGGQIVSVRFLDERWRWSFGEISGRYNIRLPNNVVDPDHEKSPRELADLCFDAIGVANYDTSALPDDARPDVDWDHANPAQELAKICDDLGCRIVPQRSTGQWTIVVTGEGADLPDDLPCQDAGNGIDPKETPDFIKIVTAPKKFQVALRLAPIGKDLDMSWRPISDLSFAPEPGVTESAFGFGREFDQMSNCSPQRIFQPDGTKISPQELALQSVFRAWRVFDPQADSGSGPPLMIFGYSNSPVGRKQLILSDELVQVWTDDRGAEHHRPAYIFGSYYGELAESVNYPAGTRIDYQGQVYKVDPEERASFSLSLDPADTDRSIVTTSKPMVFETADANGRACYTWATLFLTCAVQVRDADTWQAVRHEYLKQVGTGTDESFCLEVIKDDIQPWYITTYNADGSPRSLSHNQDEVDLQCRYYADALAKTFEIIQSSTRTYIGLFGIDLDGAIEQVSYRISKSGADTIASRGTEHDFDIPNYEERRQREGRRDIQKQIRFVQDKQSRLEKQRGTFNT